MTDFREPGPLLQDEMKTWMQDVPTRLLEDICMVASGYDPHLPETKAFDFLNDSGCAARIREAALNDSYMGKLRMETKDGRTYVNRNTFIPWLAEHPLWKAYPPVQTLYRAWIHYRVESTYPDAIPSTAEGKAFKAIEIVRKQLCLSTVEAAIGHLCKDEEFSYLRENLVAAKGENIGKLLSSRALATYHSGFLKTLK